MSSIKPNLVLAQQSLTPDVASAVLAQWTPGQVGYGLTIDSVGNNLMLALWHKSLDGAPRISLIASQDEAVSGAYRGLFPGRIADALAQLKGEIEYGSWDMSTLFPPNSVLGHVDAPAPAQAA